MNGHYGIDFFINVYFYLYELIYIANVAENFASITCNFANFFWAFILLQSFTQLPFNANLRVCISLDDQDSIECDGDENTRCLLPIITFIIIFINNVH